MMMKYFFPALLLAIVACKSNNPDVQTNVFLEDVLSEYPTDVLSVKDPVFLTFATTPDNDLVENNAIKINPITSGSLKKVTDLTFAFYPDQPFSYSQKYQLVIDLEKVFHASSPGDILAVPFSTKKLEFSISPSNNLNYQKDEATIQGTIYSSDWTDNKTAENILNTSAENVLIEWNHSTNGKVHNYTISGIQRESTEKELVVFWKNKDQNFSGKKSYSIAPKGVFSLSNIYVDRPSRTIKLYFSNPVLKPQRLEGLISIDGEEPVSNYQIEGSSITIFLGNTFSSEKEMVVSDKILSINNERLREKVTRTIQFDPIKPEVRLMGQGVITPYQEEVIFPFEAIGLNAVDVEVVQVFENNVLQYLQNNRLNESPYYIQQVGRIIHQEKVDLTDNEDINQWKRYVLDLQQFTDVSPGALYIIRLGFRQLYTDYPCDEGVAEGPLVFNKENPESILRWNYDYEGYTYAHESNPCYPVYYNENRFIQRNILASNIGVIAKMGSDNRLSITVNDVNTLEPIEGANIEIFDYQKQALTQALSDGSGHASFEMKASPGFVVVKKGVEYAYLNIQDQYANSLSDFDIGGLKKEKGIDGYIYGERGVWRPGDTMHLTFVLEDNPGSLPDDHPVSVEVKDAQGQIKFKKTDTKGLGGMYYFKVPTSDGDVTGAWNALVSVGNNTFSKRLRVETIKPNRLKIALEIPEDAVIEDQLDIPFSSSWLHGAPANQLKATVDASFVSASTSFSSHGNYTFVDPARKINSTPVNVFSKKLGSDGSGLIVLNKSRDFLPPGKVNLRLKTRVYEPTGEFSEDNINATIHPYNAYVGIKSPETRWGYHYLPREGNDQLSMVVVDPRGKPLANRKINIGLYEAEWQWWYSRSSSNIYRFDASNHLEAQSKESLVTDKNGAISWRPEDLDGYRYMVRACDEESGHCTGILLYTSYYDDQSNEGGASALRLTSDKTTYTLGETISLQVPSNTNSKIFISLENGNGIIKEMWADGQQEQTEISIPVEDGMTPNIYVHVMLLQKHNDNPSDLPMRMYGVLPLTIHDPATVLKPVVAGPEEIRPKQKYKIAVSEENGEEMYYTLAVVDEGLLGLTRFKTPDLHNHFYAKQSLGVKTWDLYDMILTGYGHNIEKHISIGGDGDTGSDSGDRKANRFVPVVEYIGPFHLAKGKTVSHELTMDNYMGEVRVMVVARNKKAYGETSRSIPVTNPVMVLPTIPRVLSPQEFIDLPINVFVTRENIKNVNLTLDLGPGLSTVENKTKRLTFSTIGDQVAHFPVLADDYQGPTYIRVTASANGESIDQTININIENPNPFSYKVMDRTIGPGETIEMAYSPHGTSGTNTGSIELSTFPAINLEQRLDYLIRYPYGCVEQTTSAVFPQLYLENIVAINQDKKSAINRNLTNGIKRLLQFQQSTGGLSYWKGSKQISEWGTSYAGHFLLEAQERGFFVPDHFWQKWLKFQKKLAGQYNNDLKNPRADLMQAYRLFTLSRSGNPDWAAMNLLRNEKLDDTARHILAAAYASSSQKDIAALITGREVYTVNDYVEMSYTYGSSLRDKALVASSQISTTEEVDDNTATLIKDIAYDLGKGDWYSTQSTAFALMAIGKYLAKVPSGSLDVTLAANNLSPEKLQSSNPIIQKPMDIQGTTPGTYTITNHSNGSLYARVILKGQSPYGSLSETEENLKMVVRYTDLDGNTIDVIELAQGTDFISEVTVINPGSRHFEVEELALSQVFPSGWEIQNDRISGNTSAYKSDAFEYQDIRDDRVNTFFDLKGKKTFRTLLSATYSGTYFLPDTYCHAMYDHKVSARKPGRWITITPNAQ